MGAFQSEAEVEGWFNGPPYALPEKVFDEDDIASARLGPILMMYASTGYTVTF